MTPTEEMVRVAAKAVYQVSVDAIQPGLGIQMCKFSDLPARGLKLHEDYARAAITAALAAMWQPIETAKLDGLKVTSETFLLSHIDRKWVRFGKWYVQERCWYYSSTSERSQWAQVRGDEPTHWAPFLPAPTQLSTRMGSEKTARLSE